MSQFGRLEAALVGTLIASSPQPVGAEAEKISVLETVCAETSSRASQAMCTTLQLLQAQFPEVGISPSTPQGGDSSPLSRTVTLKYTPKSREALRVGLSGKPLMGELIKICTDMGSTLPESPEKPVLSTLCIQTALGTAKQYANYQVLPLADRLPGECFVSFSPPSPFGAVEGATIETPLFVHCKK